MRALTPVDQAFLWLEGRRQPMHVGGLQLYTPPEDAPPDFVHQLAEGLRESTLPKAPFNLHLSSRFGIPFWDVDRHFDIEHHFRHLALPEPGRIRELLKLVSQQHSALLDRSRPLWEYYLIEGLEDGRFAFYCKIHHSLVDGIAAMRLLESALSSDPNATNLPAPWAIKPPRRRRGRRDRSPLAGVTRTLSGVGNQLAGTPKIAHKLYQAYQDAKYDPDYTSMMQAPRCILNQRITGSRRFAAQSYSLPEIKAVGKKLDATVNDMMLAMCAGALRTYLRDLDALPDDPLIAMVPMSLRRDDTAEGNQVGMIFANLGTQFPRPLERLDSIKRSINDWKRRYADMSPAQIMNFTAMLTAPAGLNLLTGLAPRWQSFNLVISNVPGPREPLYWNGARLDGNYPVSIVLDGQALNITATSYCDRLEFGLLACRRTLPRMQRLLQYLQDALDELEAETR